MSERLYVGRVVDPETLRPTDQDHFLKPDRLTRHAVCLGMTGSGKTGLCVTLLEEMAMAGVPVLVIDPKGDMANLALAFTGHPASAFEPWVDDAEASRQGLSTAELAEKTASLWRDGLSEWGVDDARVRRFTEGCDVSILTPGSNSGIPVDVLSVLSIPDADLLGDEETLRDLVTGTISSILGLVGVEADPVNDPEHIVLSTILTAAWRAGEDADMETLIVRLVDPPFAKVGVFPVDTFFKRSDRMKLAMKLNGIIASPAFASWSEGVPMDIDALLAPVNGKTPIRVFYTAHLADDQRMFFISALLNRVVAWSRRQSGTSALRAMVYFDEVYGFLPPHPKNPPTKQPVLTLMKQARAVGVGVMLVTQNPVDVDYKALSNAGTWFIGRLQTEQDRERVLDGLGSASGEFDRATVSGWLQNMPSRTFVLRDVKEDAPILLHSRWAISYLRGPLTRIELEKIDQNVPVSASDTSAASVASVPVASSQPAPQDDGLSTELPPCPNGYAYRFLDPGSVFRAGLQPYFLDSAQSPRDDRQLVWRPAVHAQLDLIFDEGTTFRSDREEHRLFFPFSQGRIPEPAEVPFEPSDFLSGEPSQGLFAALPEHLDEAKELKAFEKRILDEVFRGETTEMYKQRALRLVSGAGEARDAFEIRVREAVQERIDTKVAKLKDSVDRKVQRLDSRRRQLEERVSGQKSASRAQTATEVMSAAETVFGLFFGGRRKSVSAMATKRQQSMRAAERVGQTERQITENEREVYDLTVDTEDKIAAIENDELGAVDDIETVEVRLERSDLKVRDYGIVWVPVTRQV